MEVGKTCVELNSSFVGSCFRLAPHIFDISQSFLFLALQDAPGSSVIGILGVCLSSKISHFLLSVLYIEKWFYCDARCDAHCCWNVITSRPSQQSRKFMFASPISCAHTSLLINSSVFVLK